MKPKISEKEMKIRKLITLLLVIDFIIVLVTGIPMVQFLGIVLPKTIDALVRKIHTISGIIMGVLGILHIWIELRVMKIMRREIISRGR